MKRILAILSATALIAGCGTPGAPMPPSLELPVPVKNLQAVRQGNTVTLTWNQPQKTTDRENVKHPGPTRVCRGIFHELPNTNSPFQSCSSPVADVPPIIVKQEKNATPPSPALHATDQLPADSTANNPTGYAAYAVEALSRHGRAAGFSKS